MSSDPTIRRPPLFVAAAGWLVPGAGYWLIGQRARAVTVGVTIVILFVMGAFIGGMRSVEAPDFAGSNPLGWVGQLINQRPWFIGQFLTGPVSLVPVAMKSHYASQAEGAVMNAEGSFRRSPEALQQSINAELNRRFPTSHGRMADIGTLYTAVAGMLNLLAIIDCGYRAGHVKEKP